MASRFDNVRSFINALSNLGFKMVSKVRGEARNINNSSVIFIDAVILECNYNFMKNENVFAY